MDNNIPPQAKTTIPFIAFAILVLLMAIFFFTKDKTRQKIADKSIENGLVIQEGNSQTEQN